MEKVDIAKKETRKHQLDHNLLGTISYRKPLLYDSYKPQTYEHNHQEPQASLVVPDQDLIIRTKTMGTRLITSRVSRLLSKENVWWCNKRSISYFKHPNNN